jgi:hypothetical protein
MMKKNATGLMYLLKKGRLLACGLIHFGPRQTYLAQKSLSLTLDAFEVLYDRLPDQDEQLLLVRKLSWFNEQHNRLPTQQEAEQMVQQIEVR